MRQLKIGKTLTPRDGHLDTYLQEIGRIDLVSADEEFILTKKIKMGDEQALQKLTKANLRFVVSVAKQYQNQGLPLPDLINDGNLGLIKAVKRFDETRGFKLISYAVWWIRQSILQALAEQAGIVRRPLNVLGNINKMRKHHSKLEQVLEREPTDEELAEIMNEDLRTIHELASLNARGVSLDKPLGHAGDEDERRLLDVLENPNAPADPNLTALSLKKDVALILKNLSEIERNVIICFFGLHGGEAESDERIGDRVGKKRERIRQIREKAIRKMKGSESIRMILKQYLG